MKATLGLLGILLAAGPSISYFGYQRQINPAGSGGQLYFIVDEAIWRHARPDLGDLRVYQANKEIPYKLSIERDGSETDRNQCRVLQPGIVGGKTQFLLDMTSVPEYDRVELKLGARNFVAHASIEGQDDPHGSRWTILSTSTLYDLTAEKLGHNIALQMPLATFKYLRVTMDNSVTPSDIEGATAGSTRTQKAVWRDLSSESTISQEGKDTLIAFTLPENLPVERINLTIDPAQTNFLRGLEVKGEKGEVFGSGEISTIYMRRNGQQIDTSRTWLAFQGPRKGNLKVTIHNGDDVPLKITAAHLQQFERRIYFDADSDGKPNLYYGDAKLDDPIYDYAKLFQRNKNAAQVPLQPETANSAFTGRPDDRPWSERHPAVLWIVFVAAVLILGGIALRSLKTA